MINIESDRIGVDNMVKYFSEISFIIIKITYSNRRKSNYEHSLANIKLTKNLKGDVPVIIEDGLKKFDYFTNLGT